MRKRTAHRWRLLIIMSIGVVFALGSFWLVQLANIADSDMQASLRRNEPDYIVDNFSFVRMTPEGQPRYIISGTKLTHRPVDDASEIEHPAVQSLSADQPPMLMHAQHARVDHANTQVHLLGGVNIERAAAPNAQYLSLKTEQLTILPDDDVMQTDQPVDMTIDKATAQGVGLLANNATRQIHLGGRGKIIYPPAQAR